MGLMERGQNATGLSQTIMEAVLFWCMDLQKLFFIKSYLETVHLKERWWGCTEQTCNSEGGD